VILLVMHRSGKPKNPKLAGQGNQEDVPERSVTSNERVVLTNFKDYIWIVNKTVCIWRKK